MARSTKTAITAAIGETRFVGILTLLLMRITQLANVVFETKQFSDFIKPFDLAFKAFVDIHTDNHKRFEKCVAGTCTCPKICASDKCGSSCDCPQDCSDGCTTPDKCHAIINSGLFMPSLCKKIAEQHQWPSDADVQARWNAARKHITRDISRTVLPFLLVMLKYPSLAITSLTEVYKSQDSDMVARMFNAEALTIDQASALIYLKHMRFHGYRALLSSEKYDVSLNTVTKDDILRYYTVRYQNDTLRTELTTAAKNRMPQLAVTHPWICSQDTVLQLLRIDKQRLAKGLDPATYTFTYVATPVEPVRAEVPLVKQDSDAEYSDELVIDYSRYTVIDDEDRKEEGEFLAKRFCSSA